MSPFLAASPAAEADEDIINRAAGSRQRRDRQTGN
jgi:hypothetical protein